MNTLPLFTAAYGLPQFDLVRPPSKLNGFDFQQLVPNPGPEDEVFQDGLPLLTSAVVGSSCNNQALSVCVFTQAELFNRCRIECNNSCGPDEQYPNAPQTVACELCRKPLGNCDYNRVQGLQECRRLYACSGGLVCTKDIRNANDYCCKAGDAPCAGMCGGAVCNGQCVPDLRYNQNHCGICGNVCAAGQTCCGGQCVSALRSNPDHCGACGNSCGLFGTCCNGQCFNLQTDKEHCGTCSHACPSGGQHRCCSGQCRDIQTENSNCGACDILCPNGKDCCKDYQSGRIASCVDLQTDNANCGMCGNNCPPNATGQQWTCCGGTCAELQADVLNCGSCSKRCPFPKICIRGQCGCPPWLKPCPSAVGGCCDAGQECCNGVCTSTQTDRDNCGRCGYKCSRGQFNNITCVGGKCVCPPDWVACTHSTGGIWSCCPPNLKCCNNPGNAGCMDLMTDNTNCGGCGISCFTPDGSRTCQGGVCVCRTPDWQPCGSKCCPKGQPCINGVCALPCNTTQNAGQGRDDSRIIYLGQNSGVFPFLWDTYNIPDLVEIWYEGRELLQEPCCQKMMFNRCVGTQGWKRKNIFYSGSSSFITVKVFANCSPGNTDPETAWRYVVGCPVYT